MQGATGECVKEKFFVLLFIGPGYLLVLQVCISFGIVESLGLDYYSKLRLSIHAYVRYSQQNENSSFGIWGPSHYYYKDEK